VGEKREGENDEERESEKEEKERRGRVCVIGKYPRSLLVNDRYAKL
jgi:hypothetical protein